MVYRSSCPICGNLLVKPGGPASSAILIVGEFPGWLEIKQGKPWVGRAGDVLHSELLRAGLPPAYCRMTNMWLHEPNEIDGEFDWHWRQLMKELEGRKAVFLLGSDVARRFLDAPISDYTGLKVKSPYLPESVKVAVAGYNPAVAIQRGARLGEVRLACEHFAEAAKKFLEIPT